MLEETHPTHVFRTNDGRYFAVTAERRGVFSSF